ncbi:hypothetical protein [Sorangium sp. So ce406]|uniref:hypothetical protein n=1 Tax=Sorangium sp. So ce406 TaxID=3133311 RepID=UPI003F5C4922
MASGTMRLDEAAQPWADSSARYRVATEHEGTLLTVAVRCRIAGLPFESQALLDTGAAWSIIGGDLAELLQAQLGASGQTMILSTRLGRIRGALHDLDVVLVAERGESLAVSGSILIAPGWIGPVVLGYRGFLERLRFALDPGCGPDDAWFFFSSAG